MTNVATVYKFVCFVSLKFSELWVLSGVEPTHFRQGGDRPGYFGNLC